MTDDAKNYKATLNLPKTSFDMKANLTTREPEMVKRWRTEGVYRKIRAERAGSEKGKWVLHDGPPYANGDIHMGHLINKVLKDIVVKFRTMQGYDSPYVPGWDCHGLPIESAIQKELGPKFRELTKEEVRKRCGEYAMNYVKLQGDSFQRLGVFGEFERPYLTLDPKYEGGILDVLAELVKRDLVYRQKKPVHWCTNDRTALAEAELEYQTKKDSSVYVIFDITEMPGQEALLKGAKVPIGLMIWTTTPWTLPANRAVAVHPDHEYVFIYKETPLGRRFVVVARQLAEKILKDNGDSAYQLASQDWLDGNGVQPIVFTGSKLVQFGTKYCHPLDSTRVCPVVLADYVTLEDGTGLVHTAPGHGKEDYQTGIKYGLEVYNPVLSDGRYDDTVSEFLRGKTIWDANALIIEKLKETGALFHHQEFSHEYPHCWRCKKPTIQRATEQWFVKASGGEGAGAGGGNPRPSEDAHSTDALEGLGDASRGRELPPPAPHGSHAPQAASRLWKNAKKFVDDVAWIPEWGKNRIEGMLDTRPDWCISRQRSWGVPIPALFDPQGKCLLTEASVHKAATHFRAHGADSWYTDSPDQILGTDAAAVGFPAGTNMAALEKGMDILDVWFESGASHHAVLECTHPELGYPANMYLEGSDQHRGWFQSSLLEASGYKSEPPFKEVLTHGFVVDEQGKKYSKSSGNYVTVDKLLQQNGADVLRLFVCSVDYQNDIRFSPAAIATIGEAYRKIRNTIRYLLGNLYDFDPMENSLDPQPQAIDQWMKNRVDAWARAVYEAYGRYEFHTVFKLIYEFCNVEISAVYAKAIKDRLYCELPDAPRRRASQTVCYRALMRLIELCAPVLVFTAEEAWGAVRQLPGCDALEESVHLATFSVEESPVDEVLEDLGGEATDPLEALSQMAEKLGSAGAAAAAEKHWAVLMPLVEKGNKQLDELKRTVGLGNPLDAEAVIIVPTVRDEVSALIEAYGPEIEDALGVGYHRVEHGEMWDIKINDTREMYGSCARSWKRRPDVGSDAEYPDLSKRDAEVVRALRAEGSAA
jgi:isoleucyl-tRNA synthetase